MITENLSTLKIHKLTQEQYDRELEAGRVDPSALYLTPDNGDNGVYVQNEEPIDVPDGSLWVDMDDGDAGDGIGNFVTYDELDAVLHELWDGHLYDFNDLWNSHVNDMNLFTEGLMDYLYENYATKDHVNDVIAQAKSYIDETILGGAW